MMPLLDVYRGLSLPSRRGDTYFLTLACRSRGLIVDRDDNIIARPFGKFFNHGERLAAEELKSLYARAGKDGEGKQRLPPVHVYDKVDGSLGILYWTSSGPMIATRGSFQSEQAGEANKML